MTTKEELVQYVKKWLMIEEEIKDMQKIIREKKRDKKELTNNLVSIMKENDIDCFDIQDGKLMYTKSKVKQALSKKHLMNSLLMYFQNDDMKAKDCAGFILETRKINIRENIRHKIKKK